MKKLFVSIIISVCAVLACGFAGCSKGNTFNGETMEKATEKISLNQSDKADSEYFANGECKDCDDNNCPNCDDKNCEDGKCQDENCPNCDDERKDCEDCKKGKCEKHKNSVKPDVRQPRFYPGKDPRFPKRPRIIPHKINRF